MTGQQPAGDGSVFTAIERAYLQSQRLARLATVDPHGHPQNSPVGLHYNPATDTIDIIGWNLTASRKYRNATNDPHVALVVDDMPTEGAVRGIEIRGHARPIPASPPATPHAMIRVHPDRIITWGLDQPDDSEPGSRRAFPTGRSAATEPGHR
jgi:pyridoxamine 5'-phosphate oxidase family protein